MELPGPTGWRQSAPCTGRHQLVRIGQADPVPRRDEHARERHEQLRPGAWVLRGIGRPLGHGDVTGLAREPPELPVRHRPGIDPEPADRDLVRRRFLRIVPVRPHQERRTGNPYHAVHRSQCAAAGPRLSSSAADDTVPGRAPRPPGRAPGSVTVPQSPPAPRHLNWYYDPDFANRSAHCGRQPTGQPICQDCFMPVQHPRERRCPPARLLADARSGAARRGRRRRRRRRPPRSPAA